MGLQPSHSVARVFNFDVICWDVNLIFVLLGALTKLWRVLWVSCASYLSLSPSERSVGYENKRAAGHSSPEGRKEEPSSLQLTCAQHGMIT